VEQIPFKTVVTVEIYGKKMGGKKIKLLKQLK